MISCIAQVTHGVIPTLEDISLPVMQGVLVQEVNCLAKFTCHSCVLRKEGDYIWILQEYFCELSACVINLRIFLHTWAYSFLWARLPGFLGESEMSVEDKGLRVWWLLIFLQMGTHTAALPAHFCWNCDGYCEYECHNTLRVVTVFFSLTWLEFKRTKKLGTVHSGQILQIQLVCWEFG